MPTITPKNLLAKIQKIDKNINMTMLRRAVNSKLEQKGIEPNKETVNSTLKEIAENLDKDPKKTIDLFKKRIYAPGPRDSAPGSYTYVYDDDQTPPPPPSDKNQRGGHERIHWK